MLHMQVDEDGKWGMIDGALGHLEGGVVDL